MSGLNFINFKRTCICFVCLWLIRHVTGVDVKFGVILPGDAVYQWSLKRVVPAIDLAVENVKKRDLLPGCQLSVYIADSECSETMGPLAAIDFHMNHHVNVFLGPVCEYAISSVARFSPHWGIPVLSAGAFVAAFDNKKEYQLLTRVNGAYLNGADFFIDTARNFNWTRLGLIYNQNTNPAKGKSDCYFTLEALFLKLKTVFGFVPWHRSFDESRTDDNDDNDFEGMIKDASENTRSKQI